MNIEELKQRAAAGDAEAYTLLYSIYNASEGDDKFNEFIEFLNMLQSKVMRRLHACLQICTLQVGDKATHMK